VRGLIDLIEVGPLFAVDLDVDESGVHRRGDLRILERFVRHHVAPVARRIADRQQYRSPFAARERERLVIPWLPVDRILCVLKQIRARFAREAVGHDDRSAPQGRA
jgi:hypothetical protein